MSPFNLGDAAKLLEIITDFRYRKRSTKIARVEDVAEDIAQVVQEWFVRGSYTYPYDDLERARKASSIEPTMPREILDEIENYIENREPPGDFVLACLSNDEREAERCGSEEQRLAIVRILYYLQIRAPADCWGNELKVNTWLDGPPGSFDDGRRRQ